MDLRRSFWPYGLSAALLVFVTPIPLQFIPSNLFWLLSPPLGYAILVALAGLSAWLISPPSARGWWVLRYGAAVLLAQLVVLLAVVAFPTLDPFLRLGEGTHDPLMQGGLIASFVLLLWPLWLVSAKPNLVKR
jgi:hypothetical protein